MRLLLPILVLLWSDPLFAEPLVNIAFEHYDIYPTAHKDLRNELIRNSPIKKSDQIHFGHTAWTVEWRFKWRKQNGQCKINQVTTSLDVTYILPRIAPGFSIDSKLEKSFNRYYDLLFAHEQEHMKSGLYAARDIEAALLNLKSFEQCNVLDKHANATGHALIEKYKERDREYDRKTRHGKSEGVDIRDFM